MTDLPEGPGPRETLSSDVHLRGPVTDTARLDIDRTARCGVPELVLAEGKSDEDLVPIVDEMVDTAGACIATRLDENRAGPLLERHPDASYDARARVLVVGDPSEGRRLGRVAVLAAGTADVSVAEEAARVLEALGADVVRAFDIGVAGIHRLYRALDEVDRDAVDCWIVCAGREGALPTVVAGLVRGPVVGLPVSTGYGHGGRGEAALSAMLQSCAPLAVVNVDAGAVAAAVAVQFLDRLAEARRGGPGLADEDSGAAGVEGADAADAEASMERVEEVADRGEEER